MHRAMVGDREVRQRAQTFGEAWSGREEGPGHLLEGNTLKGLKLLVFLKILFT